MEFLSFFAVVGLLLGDVLICVTLLSSLFCHYIVVVSVAFITALVRLVIGRDLFLFWIFQKIIITMTR